jgi:SAM-dependent methyltransferase
MEYDHIFTGRRATQYFYATTQYPNALSEEFKTAVSVLDLKPGHRLLNIPAAAIHIGGLLPAGVVHHQIETCKEFATAASVPHGAWTPLPFPTGSLDRVLTLASLHHSTQAQRDAFYAEALRVLKPGGKLVIGDVRRGSKEAEWLNVFVHLFNPNGHKGRFFSRDEDAAHLRRAGFDNVQVSLEPYHWNFSRPSEMVDFCRNLFGLDLATDTDIEIGLVEYLHPVRPGRKSLETKIPWELIYFVAIKP